MCTNFKIKTTFDDIIVGRSQEFSQLLGRSLMFRKAGHQYVQNLFDPDGKDCLPSEWAKAHCQFTWEGDYGFVAMQSLDFDQVEKAYDIHIADSVKTPIATDGINTEGLYVGCLLQNAADYPAVTDPAKGLAVTNLIDYILSTCQTCEDVKERLAPDNPEGGCQQNKPQAHVQVTDSTRHKLFHQHFPVHDRFGNSIVVEFINGQVQIHENNQYGVLTNDPDFQWHITNLNNYANVTPVSSHHSEPGNLKDIEIKSQGNGFSLLPGGPLPTHRFIRAAMMVNYAKPVSSTDEAINLAAHILNTVDIPVGVIREIPEEKTLKPELDYTQYITLSDLSNQKFYVRLYDSPQVYSVDLSELDLDTLNGKTFDIPRNILSTDLTEQISASKIASAPFQAAS
ncbi:MULTISPECIES: linear amide C-N hydrolase [unclassified Pseudoalteromonas]|uniref:linear amide C-N hydrolase n=1 Tax=unclassified Pseudoalteromonas TaxID=194690 RepID=UPI0020986689|nr:linear amide C-N hydrolase [Pseudoalteromonas sp. XMcav2-N]MCO7189029.1 linear amide C-N hydrolase [Pseudoalteromonas sp. XMcav2-N]